MSAPTPDGDDFWPVLEQRIREQIKDLDRQVEVIYQERARLQFFLNDHGRTSRGGGEG